VSLVVLELEGGEVDEERRLEAKLLSLANVRLGL